MGAKQTFLLPFFKYWSNEQIVSEKKFGFDLKTTVWIIILYLNVPIWTVGPKNHFSHIGVSAIWDQHCRFLSPSRDSRIDGNSETRILCILNQISCV